MGWKLGTVCMAHTRPLLSYLYDWYVKLFWNGDWNVF